MEMLQDKGAVVIGAASAIGRAIAWAFIDAGASVLLCDRNYRAVEVLAHQLSDRAIGRFTDLADERQVAAALHAARAAFGTVDIVVNCAGFGAMAPLNELTDQKWRSVVIINISSVNERQPGAGPVADSAAKAGVDMITRCGALELGGRGIRVVGIAPGLVETPLTRKELEDPAMRELFLGVIPMKRPIAAAEIAAAAVFLASDQARSINGETIAIDGAWLTRGYPALLTGVKKAS
jgi:NAD(P)-dependent dehydrogenase (short-subunit alcohol dehydrogenase family)